MIDKTASRKGKVLNAIIPTETHQSIEKFLKENGMSQASLVRLAVAEFLSKRGIGITVNDLTPGTWGGHRK